MGRHALTAALALWACAATASVEDRRWCRTTTEHFDLVTDLSPRRAAALLAGLDRFRTAASALLPGRPLDPPATPRLLVFKRARDFVALFDRPDIVGFMQPSLLQSLLALGPDRQGRHLHTFAYHEYTHFLLRSRAMLNMPAWYEEGLATYLANLHMDENGVVTAGRGPHALLRFLVEQPQTHLEQLLEGRFRLGGRAHDELSHAYALAWGLVRFLHHAKRPDGSRYAESLGAMLAAIDQGATSADALREIGIAVEDLPRLMRNYYTSDDTATVFRFAVDAYEMPTQRRECLDDFDTRHVLAAAVARHHPKKAAAFYNYILARQPRHTGALIGRSEVAESPSDARRYAQAALAVDPQDAAANVRMAQVGMAACEALSDPECKRELEAAKTFLQRALASARDRADAIYGLGVLYLLSGAPADALAYMRRAHLFAPWSPRINFYLGEAYLLSGDFSRARQHLQKTANWHPEAAWRDRADQALTRIPQLAD